MASYRKVIDALTDENRLTLFRELIQWYEEHLHNVHGKNDNVVHMKSRWAEWQTDPQDAKLTTPEQET
jgi:hypothetical protein